jgi:antitoxin component YwqK of YwqJK toxin-antitoxin module
MIKRYFIILLLLAGMPAVAQVQTPLPADCHECMVDAPVMYNRAEDAFILGLSFFIIPKENNQLEIILPETTDTLTLHYSYDPARRSGRLHASDRDSMVYFYGDFSVGDPAVYEWTYEDEANPGIFIKKEARCYQMKKEGTWHYYLDDYRNGTRIYEKTLSWKNGKKEGGYEEKINGTTDVSGFYAGGLRIGEWIQYNSSGYREHACYSLNGQEVYTRSFYKDTAAIMKETFIARYNSPRTTQDSIRYYIRTYYKNGGLRSESSILYTAEKDTAGLQTYSFWNERGKLIVQVSETNGMYHALQWHDNGILKSDEHYTRFYGLPEPPLVGERVGKLLYWDDKGLPVSHD